jgi:uncharacterized iron-regulated protein
LVHAGPELSLLLRDAGDEMGPDAFIFNLTAQPTEPKLYTPKGKATTYKALLARAVKADVIFFGELHNSEAAHNLQLRLLEDIIKSQEWESPLRA